MAEAVTAAQIRKEMPSIDVIIGIHFDPEVSSKFPHFLYESKKTQQFNLYRIVEILDGLVSTSDF